jgi:hypothetical protein
MFVRESQLVKCHWNHLRCKLGAYSDFRSIEGYRRTTTSEDGGNGQRSSRIDLNMELRGILPINGAKRFFRSQGGHIIGPLATITILTMSTLNFSGVVTKMNWVQALLWGRFGWTSLRHA